MNPNNDNPNNNNNNNSSDSQAEKVDKTLPQDNPSLHIEMNDEVDLNPHYIHDLWTQFMHITGINHFDANSSQPITQQEDHDVFLATVTALGRPETNLALLCNQF